MADISLKGQSGSSVYSSDLTATADKVLAGKTYIGADTNDEIGTGTISTYTGASIIPSFLTAKTIPSGQYLSGNVTIAGVQVSSTQSQSSIATIDVKKGVIAKVGDSGDENRIARVTGTYTTLTGGSAIVANAIRNGYVGFVNGSNGITGNIKDIGPITYTITGKTTDSIYVSARRWLAGAITFRGDSNLIAANIRSGKSIFGITGSKIPEAEGLSTSIQPTIREITSSRFQDDQYKYYGVTTGSVTISLTSSVEVTKCYYARDNMED